MWVRFDLICYNNDFKALCKHSGPGEEFDFALNEIAGCVEQHRRGSESIRTLHMDLQYKDQCNLEFKTDQMKRISALGVKFTLSCWE